MLEDQLPVFLTQSLSHMQGRTEPTTPFECARHWQKFGRAFTFATIGVTHRLMSGPSHRSNTTLLSSVIEPAHLKDMLKVFCKTLKEIVKIVLCMVRLLSPDSEIVAVRFQFESSRCRHFATDSGTLLF